MTVKITGGDLPGEEGGERNMSVQMQLVCAVTITGPSSKAEGEGAVGCGSTAAGAQEVLEGAEEADVSVRRGCRAEVRASARVQELAGLESLLRLQ